MSSRGRALTILDISQPNWTFDNIAFNSVLSRCGNRPVAIYSINGVTRSGKSFLLNYFIRYFEEKLGNSEDQIGSELFRSESGLGRVTMGINLWSKPYFVQTDVGEVAVLLLDTQGLFDQNTTYRQNAIIFTVSCLLSSVMMYNQKGIITEDVLQSVERFSNFTNNIVYQNNLTSEFSAFNIGAAHSLLFLMRDFELPDYKYGYHSVVENPQGSNRNFFNDILSWEANNNEARAGVQIENLEENRQVRRRLQELYTELATHLLPHPGIQFVRQLIVNTNPDEEFQAEAQSFVERTVSRDYLVTKKIRGQVVTVRGFKYCIDRIEAILREADIHFSDLRRMREYDIETKYLRVMNAAFDIYKSELNNFISNHTEGVSKKEFLEKHKDAFERALIKFDRESSLCITDQVQRQRYRSQLETHVNSCFAQLTNSNDWNRRIKLIKNVVIVVGVGVASVATALVLTGPVGAVSVIATEATGAGVAATGAGVAATGAGVAATGAGVAATGATVAATGAGVAAAGVTVAGTGAATVAATGVTVTATGVSVAAAEAAITATATVVIRGNVGLVCAAAAGAGIAAGMYANSNRNTPNTENPNRT